MENFLDRVKEFILMERLEEGDMKTLCQTEEYTDLQQQTCEAVKDLIGDDPELRKKYGVLEYLEGLREGEVIVQAYLQGVKDTLQLKALLG